MLEKSWKQLKANAGILIGLTFLNSIVSTVLALLFSGEISGTMLVNVSSIILSTLIIKSYLIAIDEEIVTIDSMTNNIFSDIGKRVGVTLILSAIVTSMTLILAFGFAIVMACIGSVLEADIEVLIVVSFILIATILMIILTIAMLFTAFIMYAIIDKSLDDLDLMERIKFAVSLTNGYKLKIIGYSIVSSIVSTAGIFAFLIGVIVTTPLAGLIMANLYVDARNERRPKKDDVADEDKMNELNIIEEQSLEI